MASQRLQQAELAQVTLLQVGQQVRPTSFPNVQLV
ncbi:hypothetical protein swp_2823 [Shewanella piezotolerans WP3]|uniref:Uncharacterized protein n=1 Tax=Shewanella piezotolerans (strain WP3 / JCM 13877) TaxID=225849 RepID=B8CPH4_SHEPW|nr:hypothetical protein swp_2823 [Shewanella piezotolerans WP3]